jgi:hypothetical protein
MSGRRSKTFKVNKEFRNIDQIKYSYIRFLYYIEGINVKSNSIKIKEDRICFIKRKIEAIYDIQEKEIKREKTVKISFEKYEDFIVFSLII